MTEEKQMACLMQRSKCNTDFVSHCIVWRHEVKSEELQNMDVTMQLGQMQKLIAIMCRCKVAIPV